MVGLNTDARLELRRVCKLAIDPDSGLKIASLNVDEHLDVPFFSIFNFSGKSSNDGMSLKGLILLIAFVSSFHISTKFTFDLGVQPHVQTRQPL